MEKRKNAGASQGFPQNAEAVRLSTFVTKPLIHLWVYNHPLGMISDQINFFVLALQQHGYPVSVGRRPCQSALNVVIENFSPQNRDVLLGFCRTSKKRVAIIMTEHLDYEHGRMFFHGVPLGTKSDYIPPETGLARLTHMLECLPCIRCIFVLGDLPELRNISTMLPRLDIRSIPFPQLNKVSSNGDGCATEMTHGLVFTGGMTSHRTHLLAELESRGISVAYPNKYISRRRRNTMNRSGKLILNIPQWKGWRWLSLMRIIAGLQTGRPTISLGTSDASRIASCCTQLDITAFDWLGEVQRLLVDWQLLYHRDVRNYSVMATSFEQEHPFPHDMFDFWSVTDRLHS